MLVFDKTRKRCVSPPTEDCDIPPPTAQSEDEEQQGGNGGGSGENGENEQDQAPRPQAVNPDKRRFPNQGGPQPFRPDGARPAGQALPPLPPNFELPEGAEPLN